MHAGSAGSGLLTSPDSATAVAWRFDAFVPNDELWRQQWLRRVGATVNEHVSRAMHMHRIWSSSKVHSHSGDLIWARGSEDEDFVSVLSRLDTRRQRVGQLQRLRRGLPLGVSANSFSWGFRMGSWIGGLASTMRSLGPGTN
jgi:hypothetical protein